MTMLIFLALAIGVSITLQGTINGAVGGRVGLSLAVLVNTVIGFVVALIWYFLVPRAEVAVERASVPPWMWCGGLLGMVILGASAYTVPRLGAAPTMALVVLAQLGMAVTLDHLGWSGRELPLTPVRVLGAALIVLGAWLLLRTESA